MFIYIEYTVPLFLSAFEVAVVGTLDTRTWLRRLENLQGRLSWQGVFQLGLLAPETLGNGVKCIEIGRSFGFSRALDTDSEGPGATRSHSEAPRTQPLSPLAQPFSGLPEEHG